jgi:AP endonuclease-1
VLSFQDQGKGEDGSAGSAEPPPKLAKKVSDGLASMDFSSSAKTEDGRSWNIKLASWNVNGVRAWLGVSCILCS